TQAAGWYDATHVATIQEGNDNAFNGDTVYVWDGTYTENVDIDKKVTIIGNGTTKTIIDGGDGGNVLIVTSDWVNISNCCIQNSGNAGFDAGIYIETSYINISYNNITSNRYGIYAPPAVTNTNLTIYNNTLVANTIYGIEILSFIDSTISYNTHISDVYGGIVAFDVYNVSIYNNTANDLTDFAGADGIAIGNSGNIGYPNMFTLYNNSCSGNAVYGILIYITDADSYFENCNIYNNIVSDNGDAGMFIEQLRNSSISNCTINGNNGVGIYLDSGDNTSISNCVVYENDKEGLYIEAIDNLTISNCTIFRNNGDGIAASVYIDDCETVM
ncbi:unnamed protein product, partial [marine sediment metagenome]